MAIAIPEKLFADTPIKRKINELIDYLNGEIPSCIVVNTADISVANDTWQALTFNSENRDTDTMHDLVTNTDRITVTTSGLYVYGYSVMFDTGATLSRGACPKVNGGWIWPYQRQYVAVADYCGLSAAGVRYFTAGDYLQLFVYQNSGGALNVLYVATHGPVFWAAKIR